MLVITTHAAAQIPIADLDRSSAVSFEREILPVLQAKCLACHSASERQGELVLENPEGILKGGDTGPAVVAGKSGESLLLMLASHQDEPSMPPPDNDVNAKPLTSEELGLIKLWIDQGATGSAQAGVLSPQAWRPLPPGLNPIYAAAVTPDGQFAACSRANQIFIYHVPSGQLVTRLTDPDLAARDGDPRPGIAHLDLVESLTFNIDGDLLASGSFREVKLWRRPRDVRQLQLAAGGPVTATAVSPDGRLVATPGAENSIQLWNAQTGESAGVLAGHTDAISALKFLDDGVRLASASRDGTILFWNVTDGSLQGRIDTPGPVNDIEFVATGQAEGPAHLLVSAGDDNLLRTWSIPDPNSESSRQTPPTTHLAELSPDGALLVTAALDGKVSVQNQQTGETLASWTAHETPITDIAFLPAVAATDQTPALPARLATAGEDGRIHVWNLTTGDHLDSLIASSQPVRSLAALVDGRGLLTGLDDGTTTVWDLSAAAPQAFETRASSAPTASALSADGKLLATTGTVHDQPAVIVHNTETGEVSHVILGHSGPVLAVAFSPDGTRLVTGSADKTVRVWDLSFPPLPELARFDGHDAAVTAVAFNSDGTQVLSGAANNTLKLWNVADAAQVQEFAGHTGGIVGVAFVQNQPMSASADKTLRFWNAADGQQARATTLPQPATAMTLSADGARTAVALGNFEIQILQTSNGQPQQTLTGHTAALTALDFNNDGSRLLSSAPDELLIWDVATGSRLETIVDPDIALGTFAAQENRLLLAGNAGAVESRGMRFVRNLAGMSQPVTSLLAHPNGQTVYASCQDGTVRGFTLSNGAQAFAANAGSPVHDIALSPDQQVLAAATEGAQIRLFSAANGGGVNPQQLAGFAGPVTRVGFSADGTRIIGASSGESTDLLVFDRTDGALLERMTGLKSAATALAVSPGEGSAALSAVSAGDGLRTWTMTARTRITGHSQPVTSLAVVPGAALQVISGSRDGTLRQFNLENGQQIRQLNHGGPVTDVAVRSDGQRFASVSENGRARLWNAQNQQLAEMRGDVRRQTIVARLTQLETAATARRNAAQQASQAAEQDEPKKTEAEQKAAEALAAANKKVEDATAALETANAAKVAAEKAAVEAAAAAQQALLAQAEADDLAKEMSAAADRAQRRAQQLASAAQSQPNNGELAQAAAEAQTAAEQALMRSQSAAEGQKAPREAAQQASQAANQAASKAVETQKPYNEALAALRTAQGEQNLASQQHAIAARELEEAKASVPAAKEVLDAAEAALAEATARLGTAREEATAAELPLAAVTFSPDGTLLATAGAFASVHTWDADTGAAIAAFAGHAAPLRSLTFVSDEEVLSGAEDGAAILWDVNPDWRLERTIGSVDDASIFVDRVMALDFDDEGTVLVTGGGVPSRSGEIKVIRVADGEVLLSLPEAHSDVVYGVAVSPDGERIASASADKYVRTFDLATGEQIRRFEGHTNYVLGVDWKGDGQTLVSSGGDNVIKVWNAATGDQVRTIANVNNYTRPFTAVRYVGQTDVIVTASGDRRARIFNASNGGQIRDLGATAGYLHAVDVTPDQQVLVAGGHDSVLRIWNGTNGQVLQTLEPPVSEDDGAGE